MKNNEVMIKLNPKFQKEVFSNLIVKYGSSLKASKIIKIPASSIRCYKNLYFDSVPRHLLNNLLELNITSSSDIEKNKITAFMKNDLIKNSLTNGRNIRIAQLKKWKQEIPKTKSLINGAELNFEKWLFAYQKLINFGARKINYIKKDGNFIKINYTLCLSKGKKDFTVNIPKKIKIDDKFSYFFGLWCGDRAGGKRFGITNQNKKIIDFSKHFLEDYGQITEKILYIGKELSKPHIEHDKTVYINRETNGWVLSIHSNNGILASFFHYLQSDIRYFINKINQFAFFAGLFDAEGNVSLYNKSLRWACKDINLVEIYSKILVKLKMYKNYDGGCLVTYNLRGFHDKIFPYMIHDEKINLINLLCGQNGELPLRYLVVLKYIKNNPGKTEKSIAKALKETKVYSELWLLGRHKYIVFKEYPYRYQITAKGNKYLGEK